MTIRREYEEEGEGGRRKVVVTEEPAQQSGPTHGGEEEARQRDGPQSEHAETPRGSGAWVTVRRWFRMLTAWVAVGITVVEALLAFRLGFELAGANRNNGFVEFIFDATGGMVAPFEGIFASRSVDGGVLNPETVMAMVVYLVAALILMAIIWALSAVPASYRGETVHEHAPHRGQ